jgi:hypothetical protein
MKMHGPGNIKLQIYFFPQFFVTTARFAARKNYSGELMILSQLVEWMNLWVHVQIERMTQSV